MHMHMHRDTLVMSQLHCGKSRKKTQNDREKERERELKNINLFHATMQWQQGNAQTEADWLRDGHTHGTRHMPHATVHTARR